MPPARIAGVDEAGRGALAGPVVAAACILPGGKNWHPLLRDSKQLLPEQRDEVYAWITEHCLKGVGFVEAGVIDAIGILEATERAMQAAVRQLSSLIRPTYLLVDGRDYFWFDIPHSSLIRGDETEPCISAASVVAKVERDRHMIQLNKKFIQYGFDRHKGYGTAEHQACLLQYGTCPLHRQSYLRGLMGETASGRPTTRATGRQGEVAPSAAARA